MKILSIAACSILVAQATASIGDQLPGYIHCVEKCTALTPCYNIFEKIQEDRERERNLVRRKDVIYSRDVKIKNLGDIGVKGETGMSSDASQPDYSQTDFTNNYRLLALTSLFWDCTSNCKYICQQMITNEREYQQLPIVQFHGKWPFTRVCGVQEIFSVIFSLGNLMINYINLLKVIRQYHKNRKVPGDTTHVIFQQNIILILISIVGWTFSTLFHIRDIPVTESLDYFGAFAIMLANLNLIVVRYMRLFERRRTLVVWQASLVAIYILHCLKLKANWNYSYNTFANLVVGVSAMVLWILHSLQVNSKYKRHFFVYNNSLQLLPFETKILTKLNYLSISRSRLIPLLPVGLNLWLVVGMLFEICDFSPFRRLLDAHALWHLFTIFPSVIWFDWNIWDVEMMKVRVSDD